MPSTWTAVTVTVAPELADSIGSFLIDNGAPGLITDDTGDEVRITGHFAGDVPVERLKDFCAHLVEIFPGARAPGVELATVSDSAWAENWKAHFPALVVGQRLFVHPPWIQDIPDGRVGILIDPGMAFGTGHHASTRGCLLLLERAMAAHPRARVLDIGTGSGILAIAAAKLGAAEICAIDIDPDSCRITAENAAINGVSAFIHIGSGLEFATGRFDIVLANLFAPQLVEFAERIGQFLCPEGIAIGSGILREEADSVERAWEAAGLVHEERHEDERWVTLSHRRPPVT